MWGLCCSLFEDAHELTRPGEFRAASKQNHGMILHRVIRDYLCSIHGVDSHQCLYKQAISKNNDTVNGATNLLYRRHLSASWQLE